MLYVIIFIPSRFLLASVYRGGHFVSKVYMLYFIYKPISELYINYLFNNKSALCSYTPSLFKNSKSIFINTKFVFISTKLCNPPLYLQVYGCIITNNLTGRSLGTRLRLNRFQTEFFCRVKAFFILGKRMAHNYEDLIGDIDEGCISRAR